MLPPGRYPPTPTLDQKLKDIYMPARVQAPEARGGLGGLAPSPVDPLVGLRQQVGNARLELQNLRQSYDTPVEEQPAYQIPYGPQLGYSPSTGKVGVNGFVFGKDDFASALESEQYLNRPPTPLPRDEVQDWVPLSEDGYNALLKTIKEPGIFDLFGRNFDIGVQQSFQLAGAGLQFLGAEKLGSDIVQGTQQRIDQLAPFQRQFTDIKDVGDVGEFLVATLGQLSPSVIEAVVSGGLGAAAAKQAAKSTLLTPVTKQLVSKEAREQFAREVAAYQVAKQTGDKATKDALGKELGKKVALYGAITGNVVNSALTGTSDVYNELRQQGVSPEDLGARLASLGYMLPYAAVDVLPEAFGITRLLGTGRNVPKTMLGRAAQGIGVGAALGGASEGIQEALLMDAGTRVAGADYSDEYLKRIVNAAAAGATFGGVAGGLTNLAPTDLLKQQVPPTAPEAAPTTPPYPRPPGTSPDLTPPPPFPRPEGAPRQAGLGMQGMQGFSPEMATVAPTISTQSAAGIPEMFANMGRAISENFYEGWYDTLTNGPKKSSVFTRERNWNNIKQAFDRGEIRSPQDLRSLLTQLETGTPANDVPPPPPAATPAPAIPVPPMGEVGPEFFASETGLASEEAIPVQQRDVFNVPPGMGLQVDEEVGALQLPPTKGAESALKAATRLRKNIKRTGKKSLRATASRLGVSTTSKDTKEQILKKIERAAQETQQVPLPFEDLQPAATVQTRPVAPGAATLKAQGRSRRRAAPAAAVSVSPELQRAKDFLVALETGVPSNPLIVNKIARDLGLDVSKNAKVNDTIERIRAAVARAEGYTTPPDDTPPPTGGKSAKAKPAATKPAAAKPAATKEGPLKKGPKGAAVDENDGAVRVGREAGLRYVEYQTSVLAINERLQFATEDSDKAVRLFDKNPAAAIRSIAQNVIAAVGNRKYAVSNTLKKLKTDLENLAARASAGEDTNVLKQEFEELVSQLKNEYAAFRKREAALVPEKRGPAPMAGAEQTATAGTTAGGRRAGPAARKGAAETGPAKDQGVSKEAPVRQIKTVDQAQEVFSEHVLDPTLSTTATGKAEFQTAVGKLIDAAFIDSKLATKEAREELVKFLNTSKLDTAQRQVFNDAFVAGINLSGKQHMDAINTSGPNKGKERPWYAYAKSQGLLGEIKLEVRPKAFIEQERANGIGLATKTEPSKAEPADPKTDVPAEEQYSPAGPAQMLFRAMQIVTDPTQKPELTTLDARLKDAEGYIQDAEEAYNAETDGDTIFLGTTLKSFFGADGKVKQATLKLKYDEVIKGGGSFIRTDGREIKTAVDWIKSKNTVNKILAKLRVQPTAHVYKNLEALRRVNPDLYRRADAARTDGAFATTPFAGYSFGNEIIILTDQIKTEQELKFVLAHETLGHFGLRSIMTDKELNDVLFKLLNESESFRRKVLRHAAIYKDFTGKARDAFLTAKNKNFYEATKMPAGFNMNLIEAAEEVLSNYAAELDNNILFRVWNAIKDALNKIGIKFGDETARYFIRQAGRYLRTGDTTFISPAMLEQNMRELATEGVIGRFSARPVPSSLGALISGAVDIQKELMQDRKLGSSLPRSVSEAVTSSRQLGRRLKKFSSRVLERIQTLDSLSDLSQGISDLYDLFQEQSAYTKSLQQNYMEIMKFTQTPGYASTAQRLQAGKMAAFFTLYRTNKLNQGEDKIIDKLKGIGSIDGDFFVFNQDNLKKLLEMTKPDIEMFKKGFTVDTTQEAMAAGFEPVKLQMEAMPELTEKSKEWIIFNELLAVEQEKAKDILQSKYERYLEIKKETDKKFSRIKTQGKQKLGPEELKFFADLRERYMEIIYLSTDKEGNVVRLDTPTKTTIENGQRFVVEVLKALHSKEKLNDWQTGKTEEPAGEYFNKPENKKIVDKLPDMFKLGITQDHQIRYILPIFNDMAVSYSQILDAENRAMRTIAAGYVPLTRRGKWQVRLEAYDVNTGKIYKTGDGIKSLLPSYIAADETEANRMAAELAVFENKDLEIASSEISEAGSTEDVTVKVRFRVVTSEKGKNPPLGHAIDFDDFARALFRLNFQLNPREQEAMMKALTGQEESIRRNMLRSGTVGWNPDVIQGVAEDVETGAHIASKNRYSYRTDEIMANPDNWFGSEQLLNSLEEEMKAAEASGNKALAHVAKQRYAEYAYRFIHMAGARPNQPRVVTIGGKKVATKGYGERYRDEAKRLLNFYSKSSNIIDSTEGFLTEQGGWLKNLAVLLQLGGNFSSALLNFVALPLNVTSYLATYNSQRGYGGGFGFPATGAEIVKALRNTASAKFNTAESIREMIDNNTYTKFGLTFDEAVMLLNQTEEGNLQPALTNTLLQTARGGVKSNMQATAEKTWMSMFTYTEQATRRATVLAAYRLYKGRMIAAGTPESAFTEKNELTLRNNEAFKDVYRQAGKAVVKTNGDYNLYNRPELFRNHFTQFIFMYKMYPLMVVQMLGAMPSGGRVYLLGALLLLAGMKGLPFAEDIFDLIDTLAQWFKIPLGSVEAAATEMLEGIAPGLGAVGMTGVANLFGLNVSSKVGLGDLAPVTGAFRHGADPGREMMQLAGPVFSAMYGTLDTSFQLAHWGATSVGIGDKTTTLPEILRNAPSSAVKGFADGLTYLSDGRITDAQGKVVSNDVSMTVIIGRMLGFYPTEAAESNTAIRLGKYAGDYAKAIKAQYQSAYVQAYLKKDYARMREVVTDVREWNESARDTPFFIRNFEANARKAGQQAATPAAARYLKVAPESSKGMIEDLMNIYGLEEGTE